MRHLKSALLPILLSLLLVAGCSSDPASPLGMQDNSSAENADPLARAFFTGRDSFGVAFQARVADAQVTVDGENGFSIEGTGNATHLGRIQVDQQLRFDTGRDSIRGSFTFQGQQRQIVSGTYTGTRSATGSGDATNQYELEGVFRIWNHTISATKAEDKIGWANMTGSVDLDNNTLSYRLDGWLLHFVKEDEEE